MDRFMTSVLEQLDRVIKARQQEDPDSSYVAALHHKGLNKILEKLGEESIETIIAAKDAQNSGNKDALIYETADLWFHSLVMLSALNCNSEDVMQELARRFGVSGIQEKASRQQKDQ